MQFEPRTWRGYQQIGVAAGIGFIVWLLFVRDVFPSDLAVFLRAGRAVTAGRTPYTNPDLPALWSGHAFVYPYLTAVAFAPIAVLPLHWAASLYFVLGVGAVAVAVFLFRSSAPRAGSLSLLLVGAEPVVRGLQLGTVNAFLLLGLGVSWRWRDRTAVVAAAVAAVVVAKLLLAPMVLWLLATKRFRTAIIAAALAGVAVCVGGELVGLSLSAFARMLSVLSAHESEHSSSIHGLLVSWGGPAAGASVVTGLLAVVVLTVAALAYRCRRKEAYLFCAGIVVSLILSPIVWSHYYTLLLAVPLVLEWPIAFTLAAVLSSWLLAAPAGSPVSDLIHRFPVFGWVGAALAFVLAFVWHRRGTRDSSQKNSELERQYLGWGRSERPGGFRPRSRG